MAIGSLHALVAPVPQMPARTGGVARDSRQRPRRARMMPTAMLVASACVPATGLADGLGPGTGVPPVLAAAAATTFAAEPGGDPVPDELSSEADAGTYYTELMLMLAHLHLGDELYRVGASEAAHDHLVAPARDRLPKVAGAMEERGLERVVERIEALAREARASDSWLEIEGLYEATHMAIQRAQFEVDPSLRESADFQARVVLSLATRAVEQFDAAVADGAIVDEAAYQTSYGLARQGERVLREHEGLLSGATERDRYDELVASYERLMEAWPSARTSHEDLVAATELRARLDAIAAHVEQY